MSTPHFCLILFTCSWVDIAIWFGHGTCNIQRCQSSCMLCGTDAGNWGVNERIQYSELWVSAFLLSRNPSPSLQMHAHKLQNTPKLKHKSTLKASGDMEEKGTHLYGDKSWQQSLWGRKARVGVWKDANRFHGFTDLCIEEWVVRERTPEFIFLPVFMVSHAWVTCFKSKL